MIVWLAPTPSAVVLQVATPDPFTGWVPHVVMPPPVKATVPVGLAPVTVAVKVTFCPTVEGFAEDTMPVLEPAMFTLWLTVLVLVVLSASPL